MKVLGIESSSLTASVALVTDDVLTGEYTINFKKTHSQTLLPMLAELGKLLELDLSSIDAIAAAGGPGSFTGLRIGIGAVKGLAQGSGKGCVGVSTLEALACNFSGLSYTICPVMDARCGQVYTSLFWSSGGYPKRLWEDMAISLDQLKEKLASVEGEVMLVGDGAELAFAALSGSARVLLAPPALRMQSAASVGFAALHRLETEQMIAPGELSPSYLRLPQAERELLARTGKVSC